MKRAAGRARRGDGKLDRLRLAVREFVQAAGDQPSPPPPPPQHPLKGSERPSGKNRRDARKEKRRLKRSRRRLLRRGDTGDVPASAARPAPAARPTAPASSAATEKKQPEPPRQKKKPAPKAPRPSVAAPRPSAAALSRKRALLEANEEEDREIRRLERQLRLGKRRRKKGEAASEELPQSFLRDGLGYVLGALGSGAGLAGLCQSSDEEEDREPGGRGEDPEKTEEDPEKTEEDPEELVEASDDFEGSDGEGRWDSESSSREDGRVPDRSEASDPEEEEQEVGSWLEITQTCFSQYAQSRSDVTSAKRWCLMSDQCGEAMVKTMLGAAAALTSELLPSLKAHAGTLQPNTQSLVCVHTTNK